MLLSAAVNIAEPAASEQISNLEIFDGPTGGFPEKEKFEVRQSQRGNVRWFVFVVIDLRNVVRDRRGRERRCGDVHPAGEVGRRSASIDVRFTSKEFLSMEMEAVPCSLSTHPVRSFPRSL